MSRPGDTKSRALRIDVPYHKRLHRFRAWDRLLTLLIPLAAGGWLAYAYFVNQDESAFSSGPVSSRHAFFENDCAACHVEPFAPVKDADCIACHEGPLHHDNMELAPSCASCHVEHAGVDELARTGDQHCVQCHDDLKLKSEDGTLTAATQYDTQVESFIADLNNENEGHPEIALMKKVEKGEFKDLAKMRLNHREHMMKGVVYKDWDDPDLIKIEGQERLVKGFATEQGDRTWILRRDGDMRSYPKDRVEVVRKRNFSRNGKPRRILCNDCHQPDQAGDYMNPINHEKHCRDCHLLPQGLDLAKLVDDKPIDARDKNSKTIREFFMEDPDLLRNLNREGTEVLVTVPHEEFPFVRGYLRATFEKLTREYKGKIVKVKTVRKRRKRTKEEVQVPPEEFIQDQLDAIEGKIFESCKYCHEDSNEVNPFSLQIDKERRTVLNVRVPKPQIPDRWFEHTLFDHNAHRTTSCVSCHEGSGGKPDPSLRIQKDDTEEVMEKKRQDRFAEASTMTTDVLLPKIGLCMECHKPEGGARASCVECHIYHDKSREKTTDGYVPLEELVQRMQKGARQYDTGGFGLLPSELIVDFDKKDEQPQDAPPGGEGEKKDGEGAGEDKPGEEKPGEGDGGEGGETPEPPVKKPPEEPEKKEEEPKKDEPGEEKPGR